MQEGGRQGRGGGEGAAAPLEPAAPSKRAAREDPVGPAAPGPPAVLLRDVWFSYHGQPVLEAVDLRVERGELLGILGPNGGGKTTLLKLILGLLEPDRGSVEVLGVSPGEARGRVAYVPQYAPFDPRFPITVREVVAMGRLGTPGGGKGPEARAAIRSALETMGLTGLAERPVGALSGGERQRTLVARALAMDAELLLLDEPTASVDTRAGRTLYRLLEEMDEHRTVILVSHDIGVMSRVLRSVACLNRRVFHHGTGELPREALEAAYGGEVDLVAHGPSDRLLHLHGES